MKYNIDIILSSLATFFIYVLGGWDITLKVVIGIILIDFATGILSAIKARKLNSKVGTDGIIKKIMYFLLISLGVMLDLIFSTDHLLRNVCCYFVIANDGISIIENMAEVGIYVPKILKSRLEQLKKYSEEKEDYNEEDK